MPRARSILAVLLLSACSASPAAVDEALDASPGDRPTAPDDTETPSTTDPGETAQDAAVEQDAATTADGGDGVDRCPDGFPRGTASAARLIGEFSPALEGVAVCPNGDVFVSQPDTAKIFRVPLDGSPPELWTTIAGHLPLGMDCASDGVLYAADFGTNDASVFRIAAKDDPGTALPKIAGDGGYKAMNGVVAVKGVGIYATDASNTLSGRIVLFAEKSPGVFEAKVAKGGLVFPNSLGFDRSNNTLDVTLTVNAQVLSYPMAASGALGAHSIPWTGMLGFDALDGLARAENGDRYVARYLKGFVHRTSDGTKVADLKEPKSLAFRGGTLFITGAKGLFAVDLAVCGAAR